MPPAVRPGAGSTRGTGCHTAETPRGQALTCTVHEHECTVGGGRDRLKPAAAPGPPRPSVPGGVARTHQEWHHTDAPEGNPVNKLMAFPPKTHSDRRRYGEAAGDAHRSPGSGCKGWRSPGDPLGRFRLARPGPAQRVHLKMHPGCHTGHVPRRPSAEV